MKQIVNKKVYERMYYLHMVILLNCVRIPQIPIGNTAHRLIACLTLSDL